MSCKNVWILAPALALASSLAIAAGDEAGPPAGASPEASASAPVGIEGLRIYRDPASGELKPAPAGEALVSGLELTAISSRSAIGLEARTLATGAVAIDLEGRFMSFSAVTLEPGGGRSFHCADSHDGAAAAAEEADHE